MLNPSYAFTLARGSTASPPGPAPGKKEIAELQAALHKLRLPVDPEERRRATLGPSAGGD